MDLARMGFHDWLRPPRHLLALFLALTIVPAVALVYLGWRMVSLDRRLERQQLTDRLDVSADAIAASLGRELDTISTELARSSGTVPAGLDGPGSVFVDLRADGIEHHSGAALPFVPVVPSVPEPPESTWFFGEKDEYQRRDYANAADMFAGLAGSSDPKVRAGALLRLARNRRRQEKKIDALQAYADLAALGSVPVGGDPAELVGRKARAELLGEMGRAAEARQEATRLVADLQRGRFLIDRATYLADREALDRLAGATSTSPDRSDTRDGLALATAVDALWRQWQQAGAAQLAGPGRRSVWVDDQGILAVWHGAPDKLTAWFATPVALVARWAPIWQERDATITLVDAGGHMVIGGVTDSAVAHASKAAFDTHLPWTLRISSANAPVDAAAFASRRQLLGVGIALVTFLVLAGGYVVVRAVQKELAVARLQSDFVSAVSHEFRTPLTSIGTLTERLRGDRALADDRRVQYYDVLAHETERLRRFVETLLDFGRMEAGARPFDLHPLDPGELVSEVVDEFRSEPAAREHAIAVNRNGAMPVVRGDRDALDHALRNLLDNAAKYSAAGTAIDVDLGRDGDRVAIRVTDRGPGIPPAERQRIFEKFVRGSAPAAMGVKGTGVGLAMVEHIVRAHGGEVRLESEVGRGSTFTIVLPAAGGRDAAGTSKFELRSSKS